MAYLCTLLLQPDWQLDALSRPGCSPCSHHESGSVGYSPICSAPYLWLSLDCQLPFESVLCTTFGVLWAQSALTSTSSDPFMAKVDGSIQIFHYFKVHGLFGFVSEFCYPILDLYILFPLVSAFSDRVHPSILPKSGTTKEWYTNASFKCHFSIQDE